MAGAALTPMLRRPLVPLWIARPSRFAGLNVRDAWLVVVALVGLLLATLLVFATPVPAAATDGARATDGQTDIALYDGIVETVRHGASYYPAAIDAMRAGDYPLRPFVTVRLPTLAVVEAALPGPLVLVLLDLLAATVVVAWWVRLRGVFTRLPPRIVAMMLLAAGLIPFVQPSLSAFHEIWAGLLLALSLALYRSRDPLPAIAIGLAAAVIRETAGLYLIVMLAMALIEGRGREAIGWAIACALLTAVLAFHAHAVAAFIRPLDPVSPGWAGQLGFGFFVRTMTLSTGLALLPMWLAAPLVGLSLFGWAAWHTGLGLRIVVLLSGYALVLSVFGRLDTFYWGLLIAPVLLVGLVFVPDALRDLSSAVFDRRRITVKRIVR